MSLFIPTNIPMDADTKWFLTRFYERHCPMVLAVGDNEECSAQVLTQNGYKVLGVDLRPYWQEEKLNYFRLQGDFCELVESGVIPHVDCIYSLSAIEHFGLGTYGLYEKTLFEDYDCYALHCMNEILNPGGSIYLTVPYGREHITAGKDWRVYSAESLRKRLVKTLTIELIEFFKSAEAPGVPDIDGMVQEKDANRWSGNPPHITCGIKLRKEKAG